MKHISESIIGRKGAPVWPNPYDLTEKDAIGKIKGYPLEIITLALYESLLFNGVDIQHLLQRLQKYGIIGEFDWSGTLNGSGFWCEIDHNNFDVFYEIYTPKKLKERLEEK